MPTILLLLGAAIGFAPTVVRADWTEFLPTPFGNEVYLDTFTSWERDHLHSAGAQTTRWTDTFVREKLTLYSDGYSYHPRFARYRFSISGALKQENYDSSVPGVSSGWQNGSGLEYDTDLLFLPEHPYNLELFARRYEPVFKQQAATEHNSVENTRGVSFRYRKKPYFLHTGFVDDSIDSAGTNSDVQRFSLDGQYFQYYGGGKEFSLSGAFNPSWFSNSEGLSGNSTEYLLGNVLSSGELPSASNPFLCWLPQRMRLSSSAAKTTFEQQGEASGDFNNDQLSWYETLNVYLPANFRSDVLWRYQDTNSTTSGQGTSTPNEFSNIDRSVQADLVHRLYESLDTTYTFIYDDQSSSGGDTTLTSNSLALNYVKSIPWGRYLAGTTFGRADTDTSGSAQIVNESHLGVPVPGPPFTLNQPNAEASTIAVVLQCSQSPFQLVTLVVNENYLVITGTNPFQILVTNLVLNVPSGCIATGETSFDFLVSYALLGGQFTLRTDTFAANTSVQLFDDLLTPYFNYAKVSSSVASGELPASATPTDSTTYTTGLLVHRGPVRARGQYQQLDGEPITPYRAWTAEVQYVTPLGSTMQVYGTATYQNKFFPQGTSTSATTSTGAFTEQSETIAANIQKQFFARNMQLLVGGSYARLQGLVDSDAYSATAAWYWTIGKVDLTAGATAYGSNTSGTDIIPSDRDHQYVYLNLRRRLY